MDNKQVDFLNLLFEPEETICVSPDQYGYHSVDQSELNKEKFILQSPSDKIGEVLISSNIVNLVAINPISGFRNDENVTAYRTFLVELDDMPIKDQKKYIEDMGMPYTACVFSGSKSLHFAITLEEDLLSYQIYYNAAEWVLNIMEQADQMTKNPSRSIRFPNNARKETGKKQLLVELKNKIPNKEFYKWLSRFPDKAPKERPPAKPVTPLFHDRRIPKWITDILDNGIYTERNNTWYRISKGMAKAGFDLDEIYDILEQYFEPEKDFKLSEWKTSIKSGFNKIWG